MTNNDVFLAKFGSLTDEQWLDVLLQSCDQEIVDGVAFPPMPNADLQRQFVGASGKDAFKEAFLFYKEVKNYARQLGIRFDRNSRVLDFGVGWGRFYRLFLRDLATDNFVGIDVDQDCVDLCRRTIPFGSFEKCAVVPPVPANCGAQFDVVYAYSVFSHLSESVAALWVQEFSRVLKPGGMLIVTTLKRGHIQVWQDMLKVGGQVWNEALNRANFSIESAEAGFDRGKYLYCGIGGGGIRSGDFYGEAIIPPSHARQTWSRSLQLVDYVSEDHRGPQALLVLKKPV